MIWMTIIFYKTGIWYDMLGMALRMGNIRRVEWGSRQVTWGWLQKDHSPHYPGRQVPTPRWLLRFPLLFNGPADNIWSVNQDYLHGPISGPHRLWGYEACLTLGTQPLPRTCSDQNKLGTDLKSEERVILKSIFIREKGLPFFLFLSLEGFGSRLGFKCTVGVLTVPLKQGSVDS